MPDALLDTGDATAAEVTGADLSGAETGLADTAGDLADAAGDLADAAGDLTDTAGDLTDTAGDDAHSPSDIVGWATWPMPNPPLFGFTTRVPTGLPNPASYEYGPDSLVVLDRVTGLMWQRFAGDVTLDLSGARQHCADLVLDGHDDWRLPSRVELTSLLDYTTVRDTQTDLFAFPGALGGQYWTSSITVNPAVGWNVDFQSVFIDVEYESATFRARCVRRPVPQGPLPDHYDLTEAGVVRDNWTLLTWQRTAEPALMNGYDAVTYCRSLPPAGAWRLPSVKELATLVSETTTRALDLTVFAEPNDFAFNDPNEVFWTSSWSDNNGDVSFWVSFTLGKTASALNASAMLRARCVR